MCRGTRMRKSGLGSLGVRYWEKCGKLERISGVMSLPWAASVGVFQAAVSFIRGPMVISKQNRMSVAFTVLINE